MNLSPKSVLQQMAVAKALNKLPARFKKHKISVSFSKQPANGSCT